MALTVDMLCGRVSICLCENEVINQNFPSLFPQMLLLLISSTPFSHLDSLLSQKKKKERKNKKKISSMKHLFTSGRVLPGDFDINILMTVLVCLSGKF